MDKVLDTTKAPVRVTVDQTAIAPGRVLEAAEKTASVETARGSGVEVAGGGSARAAMATIRIRARGTRPRTVTTTCTPNPLPHINKRFLTLYENTRVKTISIQLQ